MPKLRRLVHLDERDKFLTLSMMKNTLLMEAIHQIHIPIMKYMARHQEPHCEACMV